MIPLKIAIGAIGGLIVLAGIVDMIIAIIDHRKVKFCGKIMNRWR